MLNSNLLQSNSLLSPLAEEISAVLLDIYNESSIIDSELSLINSKSHEISSILEDKINVDIQTFEGVKESTLNNEQECILKKKLSEVEAENEKLVSKFLTEKNEYEKRIQLLNNDLEQQIDECIEINGKLTEFSESEEASKMAIGSLIDEITNSTCSHGESLTEIVKSLKEAILSKKNEVTNISIHNDSIIDLDSMTAENFCFQNENIIDGQPASHFINIEDHSCYVLENLDSDLTIDYSKVMIEKLELLDWDESENINFLINKSISIFMESALLQVNVKKESKMELMFKQIFKDFEAVISNKLRNIQSSYLDLNNTFVFEKLERVLQNDTEENEMKEKLQNLMSENSSLLAKMNEALKDKVDASMESNALKLEISKLSSELESLNKSVLFSQDRSKQLEEEKIVIETSVDDLTLEISKLKKSLSQATNSLESSNALLDSKNKDYENLKIGFCDINEQLKLSKEDLELLKSEKSYFEGKCQEIEEKMHNILIENEELKDNVNLKKLEDELDSLKSDLVLVKSERNDFEMALESLKVELDLSNKNILEKDTALFEMEKNFKLLFDTTESLRKECDNLENNASDLRSSISDINANLQDLEVKHENAKNELIKANEEKSSLMISEERLKESLESVTEMSCQLNASLDEALKKNHIYEDKLDTLQFDIKAITIECDEMRINMANIMSQLRDRENEVKELLSEKSELIEKIAVSKVNMETGLAAKDATIRDMLSELKMKDDELDILREEFSVSRLKYSNFDNVEASLKETMEKVIRMENERDIKDEELRGLVSESSRMKNLIVSAELELTQVNLEMKSLKQDQHFKALENEELKRLHKEVELEATNKVMKLTHEFECYKNKYSIISENKENSGKLHDEIKQLKAKLRESNAGHVTLEQHETLQKVYRELKERYLDKRRRTDEVVAKYDKLLQLCKEKGIVVTKTT